VSFALALVVLCAALGATPASAKIHYRVSLAQPGQHIFHVNMSVPDARGSLTVALPAWNSLYQIRDFSYRLRDLRARTGGATGDSVGLEALDKQTWKINAAGLHSLGTVEISYAVYWDEPGPFSSQLDEKHAFANFADILLYVPDRRNEESDVQFTNVPAGWNTVLELPQQTDGQTYFAPNYDTLVDAPARLGNFMTSDFTESGARFRVILIESASANAGSADDFIARLKKLVAYELSLMKGPPFTEYTFFFEIGPYAEVGGGGMEHANCTAIAAGSENEAIATAAHEFFHAWNVKRIRPKKLEPVDYSKEQYTRALWFAEGVTSTYGAYTLVRSGLASPQQFYDDLGTQFSQLDSEPARLVQSVEESSLDAWLEGYPLYRAPDRSISYYNKGQIVGHLLDLKIRDLTDNHKSLDDVMRLLFTEYAQKGKYYDESEGIRAAVEQVAGKSFKEFFADYVSGTKEIPYQDFLSVAGLEVHTESAANVDPGFYAVAAPGSRWQVAEIMPGGAAASAGLQAGDELVSLDGQEPMGNPMRDLRKRKPGERVILGIKRDGEARNVEMALAQATQKRYMVSESASANERQKRILQGILHGTTD
jgi:predicted metalloprotease with PDZ domain